MKGLLSLGRWRAAPARSLYLTLVGLVRQGRRSVIGIGSVAFGVVAFVLAGGFVDWLYWGMREETIGSRLGHVQVARKGYRETGTADPFRFLMDDHSTEKDLVTQLKGVVSVAPRLSFSGLISFGDGTLSYIAEGIDPDSEKVFANGVLITDGEDLDAGDDRGVLVGQGLAQNLGVHVGDSVVLLANTSQGGINGMEVRVRGLFATVSKAFDDVGVRVPRSLAHELLRVKGAHVWVLFLNSTSLTDQVAENLQSALSASQMEVVTWNELADFYNKTKALFSKQVAVMKMIIAALIILSISNTITMAVLERKSEIGTCMALGATRREVVVQFVIEGLLLGTIGGIVGLAMAVLLAHVISAVGIPMPPPPGMARGIVARINVTTELISNAVELALLTALLASLYPAHIAARTNIVDSIRQNKC